MTRKSLEKSPPVYHRQRLLLYLIEHAGDRRLSKRDLQKLLLLYSAKHGSDHYAFVPYRYGAYSFHCQSDLNLLIRRGWIAEEGKRLTLKVCIADMPWARQSGERQRVGHWLPSMRDDELVAESYRRYPYYAIRSEIKGRLLSAEELQRVKAQQPTRHSSEPCVFTLGYEGMAFEGLSESTDQE